jgi:hypothetical protein
MEFGNEEPADIMPEVGKEGPPCKASLASERMLGEETCSVPAIALGTMKSKRTASTSTALVSRAELLRTGARSLCVCRWPSAAACDATRLPMRMPRWPLTSRYISHRSSTIASPRAKLSCSRNQKDSSAAASLPACCMEGTRKVVDTTIDEELFETGMGSRSFCAWRVCQPISLEAPEMTVGSTVSTPESRIWKLLLAPSAGQMLMVDVATHR